MKLKLITDRIKNTARKYSDLAPSFLGAYYMCKKRLNNRPTIIAPDKNGRNLIYASYMALSTALFCDGLSYIIENCQC